MPVVPGDELEIVVYCRGSDHQVGVTNGLPRPPELATDQREALHDRKLQWDDTNPPEESVESSLDTFWIATKVDTFVDLTISNNTDCHRPAGQKILK